MQIFINWRLVKEGIAVQEYRCTYIDKQTNISRAYSLFFLRQQVRINKAYCHKPTSKLPKWNTLYINLHIPFGELRGSQFTCIMCVFRQDMPRVITVCCTGSQTHRFQCDIQILCVKWPVKMLQGNWLYRYFAANRLISSSRDKNGVKRFISAM